MTRRSASLSPKLRDSYHALGIAPEATMAEIKSAFRKRAKELHPDRNGSDSAHADFQRIIEAYRTLSNLGRSQSRRAGPTSNAASSSHASDKAPPRHILSTPSPCRRCRKIAAQPRYIEFLAIRSRPWKTRTDSLLGVYCRQCADITSLYASLTCWLEGWWHLPSGPSRTLKALWTNFRGGVVSPRANLSLLLEQAKAFLERGNPGLAHGTAMQALEFARSDQDRRQIRALLEATQGTSPRLLKDRWQGLSVWRLVHLSPLIVLAGIGLAAYKILPLLRDPPSALTLTPPTAIEASQANLMKPDLLRSGRFYEVAVPKLSIRTGPGENYHQVAEIEAGTAVLVNENAPNGGWVRVTTLNGVSGFVPGWLLTTGLAEKIIALPD